MEGSMTAGRGRAAGPSTAARVVAALLIVLAVAAVAYLLFAGVGGYRVKAVFLDAGQLVKGNQVQAGGVAIGSVEDIDITQDGQAEVTLEIDDGDYKPLRRGTRLLIKQNSLSGIANRFVDVQVGPDQGEEIQDGGRIGADDTQSTVELDSVFSIFDPRTRAATQDFIAGQAEALRGRGRELQAGVRYLNPALSTGSRLFGELTGDNKLLRDFLVDSSALVTALGERREDLAGVVRNLNRTFGALGSQQSALGESIERLPPFLRRSNTTFVNLRAALDDVDPLVDAAKPVARRLGPFLDEARLFARDAVPTVRDLSRTIRSPGRDNDLIELIDTFPPLARAALEPRRVNGATRRAAFPETTEALRAAAPTIAQGRPYTPELVGWLDDFAATGAYDALGGFSRAWLNFSEILYGPGPKLRQFRRCPGANEEPASDRSNVLTASEQAALDCDGSERSVGP
jgi:phospholipid/cholesterol/gamma-HCH transport system substrate-binding protein